MCVQSARRRHERFEGLLLFATRPGRGVVARLGSEGSGQITMGHTKKPLVPSKCTMAYLKSHNSLLKTRAPHLGVPDRL